MKIRSWFWAVAIGAAGAAFLWTLNLPAQDERANDSSDKIAASGPTTSSQKSAVVDTPPDPASPSKPRHNAPYASTVGEWPQTAEQQIQIAKGVDAYNAGDYRSAKGVLLPLAEAGHPWAQYILARVVTESRDKDHDRGMVFHWYKAAAAQGVAEAYTELGDAYQRGREFAKDHLEATKWYRKGAELGLAEAQASLALKYLAGLGVEQNRDTAVAWYTKAADQGNTEAMIGLAMHWLGEAASRGDETAWAGLRVFADTDGEDTK